MLKLYKLLIISIFTHSFCYCIAQNSKNILIEKTIKLEQAREFGSNKWYNEGFKINLADFKELNDQATIQSISYWIGFNEKRLKASSKTQKIKKILLNSSKSPTKVDSDIFELFILKDYADTSQYNCQEKFLNGGFIVYRIYSDCYWHQQRFAEEAFGQAKLEEKDTKMSMKRLALVLRTRQKIDKPIFVKVVVNVNEK